MALTRQQLDALHVTQEAYKTTHGQYYQKRRGENETLRGDKRTLSTDYQDVDVHEHVCPDGTTGYTVYEYRTQGQKKQVKATGRGCGSHTFDWRDEIEFARDA